MQDNPKKSQIIKELLFSPALILAVISAIAYICAYLQEMGFCHSFGIPTDFIIINWPRFLSYTVKVLAAGIGGGALGTIAIDLQFAILRLHWFQSSRRAYIPQATVIIVPIGIYLIVTYDYIMLALAVIGLIYIPISYYYRTSTRNILTNKTNKFEEALSKLKQRYDEYSKKGNIDAATLTGLTSELQDIEKQAQEFARLGKQLEAELKISTAIENFSNKIKIKSVLQHGNSRILYIALVCILVLIFALGSYANGSHDAKNGKEYYVLSSNPQLVVLRTYGDNLICAPWYTETINGSNQSYVVKEYHIIKLDDVILTPKEIGPLKIAPEEYSANVSSSSP